MVQPPDAGPVSTNKDAIMITLLKKKNQYDNMFKKPDAMSRAPICNGMSKLEKVPLRPAVKTKKTMMVPWMVTKARYMLGSITPSGAHLPKKYSKMANFFSGHANCKRNNMDINTPTMPIIMPVIRNCLEIILWSVLNT